MYAIMYCHAINPARNKTYIDILYRCIILPISDVSVSFRASKHASFSQSSKIAYPSVSLKIEKIKKKIKIT